MSNKRTRECPTPPPSATRRPASTTPTAALPPQRRPCTHPLRCRCLLLLVTRRRGYAAIIDSGSTVRASAFCYFWSGRHQHKADVFHLVLAPCCHLSRTRLAACFALFVFLLLHNVCLPVVPDFGYSGNCGLWLWQSLGYLLSMVAVLEREEEADGEACSLCKFSILSSFLNFVCL